MTSVPGVDHPEEQGEADVSLTGRGISVNSRVELVSGDVITVRPSVGEYFDQLVVAVGNQVELYWKGPDNQRTMPAEVLTVDSGAVIRWRLKATGPAEESQRRKAVRARVVLPVEAGVGSVELKGETVDISEAGIRAAFDGQGFPPDPGTTMDLVVALEDGPLKTKAEVVRQQARGARWLMSIRFIGMQERDGDRMRRRVFQALREERARSTD